MSATPSGGLRRSVTLAFTVGSLLLSTLLATSTFLVARHFFIESRERSALRQTYADASFVRDGLLSAGAGVADAIGAVTPPDGSVILVQQGGSWYSSSLEVRSEDLPSGVLAEVRAGRPTLAWTRVDGIPAVVVGVPLPAVDAYYFEVAVTRELDSFISTLRMSLAGGAVATTAAGAALGYLLARRVLAPLKEVTRAAARISSGDLDTRLAPSRDPDLATVVGAFNGMVDALNERIERETRFAADVSHELRSPLTALTTSAAVLQQADLPATSRAAVELMSTELRRFQRVLEDLLELSRIDAGVDEAHPVQVPAADLVELTLAANGLTAVPVDEQPGDAADTMTVRVDKQQLSRALVNLFANAESHGQGLTAVVVRGCADTVEIEVRDDGPGVPVEEQSRIFERFARGGARGARTGAGLGLSLVAETARRHGGSVWCAAAPSGGAAFVLRLPRSDADEEDWS